MTDTLMPEDCQTMSEVRAGVDATDRELMGLIDRRFGYMRAAARIKVDRATVRDERRKAEVIANVRAHARAYMLPEDELAQVWELLVEASIAYETIEWDRARARPTKKVIAADALPAARAQ